MGALVSSDHLNKVLSYIEVGRQEGHIHFGGSKVTVVGCEGGYFVQPTIITKYELICKVIEYYSVLPNSRVCTEEIFGPVVTVVRFKEESEVIRYANDVVYGLSASVWSSNLDRALRVAHQLEVGTVWINSWMVRDLNMVRYTIDF